MLKPTEEDEEADKSLEAIVPQAAVLAVSKG
jgi:hypothetical protein